MNLVVEQLTEEIERITIEEFIRTKASYLQA